MAKKKSKKGQDRIVWHKHHLEYLRLNHVGSTLAKMKEDLVNMRLVLVTEKGIKAKLLEMGLNGFIDKVMEASQERKKRMAKEKRERDKRKNGIEHDDKLKKLLLQFYPQGGAKLCKKHLQSHNIHLSSSQIQYRAKKWGIARDTKKDPPRPKKAQPLHYHLNPVYYIIEAFNEVNGCDFNIYGKGDGSAEVLEGYLNQDKGEALMVKLVAEIFLKGFRLQRMEGIRFLVWGEE